MKTFALSLLLFLVAVSANAQINSPAKLYQPYGVIDTTDLTLKQCDFEKNAGIEILFDKGDYKFDDEASTLTRHVRIKILTADGKDQVNSKLSSHILLVDLNRINNLKAETITLQGKTIKYTPINEAEYFKQKIDKDSKTINFAFPDVQVGSVIEFQYIMKLKSATPNWYFQNDVPTRYSEVTISYLTQKDSLETDFIMRTTRPLLKDSIVLEKNAYSYEYQRHIKAMKNVPSVKTEAYMPPFDDNHERLIFTNHYYTWFIVYRDLMRSRFWALDLVDKLNGEKQLVAHFDSIKNLDQRADAIFTLVKKRMTWNGANELYTSYGSSTAWDKGKGNSTEINIILYHLLRLSGINAYPCLISTPKNGTVDTDYVDVNQFNKTIVYVKTGANGNYIMDATSKHNIYNQVPYELIGDHCFLISPGTNQFKFATVKINKHTNTLVTLKAIIQPDGNINGTAEIVTDSYGKAASLASYKNMGEKDYISYYLCNNDNNLHIAAFTIDTAGIDSVPLNQHLSFDYKLPETDEQYIYFSPALFALNEDNPFLSQDRISDIDFKFNLTNVVVGQYKLPAGYRVEALPKDQVIVTTDKSISFKRLISQENDAITVRYIIARTKSYYSQKEYVNLYQFYKIMYQMLKEQIVLKKS
jgi:hypothetical protein